MHVKMLGFMYILLSLCVLNIPSGYVELLAKFHSIDPRIDVFMTKGRLGDRSAS